MATDRPRIQGYIDQEVYERFIEWKGERGMSEALNQLLAEYFGVSPQSPIPNSQPSITTEQIEEIINERINARFEQLDNRLKAAEKMLDVQNGVPTLFQEALQTVRYQEYVIEDLLPTEKLEAKLNDLAVRLDAVEDSLEVVLGESPSNSLSRFEDTRSPEQLPQDSTPGLEEDESSSADAEPNTEEELAKDSLADQPLPGELPGELGNNALARRLGVSGSTVLKNREKPNFEEWTRGKDPDAIAWRYDRSNQRFFPIG